MLEPYRVLDLTDEKGLLCGKILADLGADVIQIEPPQGNPARNLPPFLHNEANSEKSLVWLAFSAGKRSIILNLETAAGKELFLRLCKTADFVIESFPTGYLADAGLGYEALQKANSGLIIASITPFGATGPYKDYKAGDLVASAMGGMVYCTGEPDRAPLRISVDQAYSQASLHAAIGMLIALQDRALTGRGQHVDISMQASMVRTLHTQLPYWEYSRHIVERSGVWRFRGGVATREIWPCQDGFVSWMFFGGAVGMQQMAAIVKWMETKGMAGSLSGEVQNWSTVDLTKTSPEKIKSWEKTIGDFFMAHTKKQLYDEAVERRVPLTPVNAIPDVVEDGQLAARNFWTDIDYPELGTTLRYPGPFFVSPDEENSPHVRGRAPALGEHNKEVYRELESGRNESAPLAKGEPNANKKPVMPLEGIHVLDFGKVMAGPFIGAYLGDYGAQVIKLESRSSLDLTRVSAPYKDGVSNVDRAGSFLIANSSKYGITLNLKHPRAPELTRKLISWADIVVENFGAGLMDRLGLGYANLKKIKPDIIMVSATIQGQTGPRASFVGYGWNTVALSGIANLTGWPDRSPVGTIQAYTDSVVPWFGVIAIIAALDHRRRTGEGQYIDISQYETTAHFLAPLLMDYTANGHEATRDGNRSLYAAPHGVYRCKGNERWCAITVFTESEWQAFCNVLSSPALKDARFFSLEGRKQNEAELDRLVEQWTINYTPEEVMACLQEAGVPAGVVKTNREIFEDPQLAHRGYFKKVQHTEIGECYQQAWPIELSRSQPDIRPAPCLGEHNEYVFTKMLGLSDKEFVDYLNAGVFE